MHKATLLAGLGQNPGDPTFLQALGERLEADAAWEEMIEHFLVQRSAVASGSVLDGYVHYMLGKAATALGRSGEALNWLEKAISVRPDFPFAHHLQAQVLRRLERFPEALAASERCCALSPTFPWGWLEAGEILLLLDQPRPAVESLVRAETAARMSEPQLLELFGQTLARARARLRHQERRQVAHQLWPERPLLDEGQDLDPLDEFEVEIVRFRRLLDALENRGDLPGG